MRIAAAAERDAQQADPARVIVTATSPDETSLTSPNADAVSEYFRMLPGAAKLVSADDFQRGRGAYMDDFLRYQPGVVMQSTQGSEDTKLSIRGSGAQNDDISGVALLIDGIPLNQADGEAYLLDLDLQSVKYAEVYRGADALRYGSVSLGGAVNLVTVTGREADPLTVRASFGSYGFTEQQITSGWSDQRWDIYASAVNHIVNGFRDHSQENYQKAFLSLGYKLATSTENRFYFFYGRLDQNNPSGVDKNQLYANPRFSDPESIAEQWSTRWNYARVMDRFVIKTGESQLLLAVSWNHRQVVNREEYEEDYRLGATRYYSDDFGAVIAFETTGDFLSGRNRFSLGIVPTFEPETDSSYANLHGHLHGLLAADKTYYLNFPLYVENQHYLTKTISLLTGFQAAYVNRVFEDRYLSPTLGDQSHEDHYWAFNPKLGLAYGWTEASLVYLNASRSFQPPSFDESLTIVEGEQGGTMFHELHSQHAITLELGTRGKTAHFEWDAAIYRSWVRDELLDQNNSNGEPLGTINASRTIHQGIEMGLQAELFNSLIMSAPIPDHLDKDKQRETHKETDRLILDQAYTLSDFRFDGDEVYGDHRIAGTPVHFYKAELRYEHPKGFYAGVNVEWYIVKYPVDEANSLFADPYALLGVRAGYQTRKGFRFYLEAKNLTDKVYAASVEPLGNARSSDGADSFNPGNGRAVYGGVLWKW